MKSNYGNIKIVVICIMIFFYISFLFYYSAIQQKYIVEYETDYNSYSFQKDDVNYINVTINNESNMYICSSENMYISYHLYDINNSLISYDNVRTNIEHGIFAKSKEDIQLKVENLDIGSYWLDIDIVEEGVTWFSDKGSEVKRVGIEIR